MMMTIIVYFIAQDTALTRQKHRRNNNVDEFIILENLFLLYFNQNSQLAAY